MASILKRNGRYTARVRRRGAPDQAKTFARISDARKWASETERQIDLGHLLVNDCTVGELLDRYSREITPTKRSASVEAYIVARLRRTWLSDIWLSRLTSGHLARYRDERLGEVGPSACNRDLSIIDPPPLKWSTQMYVNEHRG